ncbi:hypothetical protein [Sphingomonas jaspsi]|uniref:hypothetical protein n=1 Tax=Sphingomonas jaspsi TaxID=392409 RepID=UPI0004B4DDEB|nr:hypothetical protein [Sphingomonas jaspsi]
MMYKQKTTRFGATAIAAVLALQSTTALAQVADPAATVPTVEPSNDPVATSPSAVEPETTVSDTPVQPATETATPAVVTPKVASKRQVAAKNAPAPRARPVAANTPAKPVEAPVAVAVPTPPTAAPAEQQQAAPVVVPTADQAANSDLPLIAGGAGAAALALLGTGLLVTRRRRRDNVLAEEAMAVAQAPEPVVDREPVPERSAFAWGKPAAASAVATSAQPLPRGFDTSRFGRHVQAAYRGPTPDNPSLSLKKRIKRASFFDLRERQAAAARGSGPIGINPALVPA